MKRTKRHSSTNDSPLFIIYIAREPDKKEVTLMSPTFSGSLLSCPITDTTAIFIQYSLPCLYILGQLIKTPNASRFRFYPICSSKTFQYEFWNIVPFVLHCYSQTPSLIDLLKALNSTYSSLFHAKMTIFLKVLVLFSFV